MTNIVIRESERPLKWLRRLVLAVALTGIAFSTYQAVEFYRWRRAPIWGLLTVDLAMRQQEIADRYQKLIADAKAQETAIVPTESESQPTKKQ